MPNSFRHLFLLSQIHEPSSGQALKQVQEFGIFFKIPLPINNIFRWELLEFSLSFSENLLKSTQENLMEHILWLLITKY